MATSNFRSWHETENGPLRRHVLLSKVAQNWQRGFLTPWEFADEIGTVLATVPCECLSCTAPLVVPPPPAGFPQGGPR
jgi:hypothetical protein